MDDVKKIQYLIEKTGVTAYTISKNTDVSEGTLSRILSGKTKKPNASTVASILNYLYSLTRNVSAKISSYEAETKDVVNEPQAIWVNYESFMLVPLVNHRAQAGFLSGWGDDEYLEELPKIPFEVDKEYKGRYVCFEVAGESMESEDEPRDSLYEGDMLLCREVQQQHWRNKLHINKWDFVVVHREQGILAKRITHHDTTNGTITLHSLNPYYEDQIVKLDDLIALFNIIDVKRSRKRR